IGDYCHLAAFSCAIAIPSEELLEAETRPSGAVAVVTIENLTSFEQWLDVRPADTVAVLTGGFPGRSVIRLLRDLALPVLHWGDMDAGGFEILAYLKRSLRDVRPLAMGPDELLAFAESCRPLGDGDRRRLERLATLPELADSRESIGALLQQFRKLEQEIVPPSRVAAALSKVLAVRQSAKPDLAAPADGGARSA
ncbi:MAG: DUF2399 domain-containing protein, partial [Candidatus Sericytochromatia bacterium]|nr:DUF2399 domain-containing protein [Candidatus Tanganyikabacteria bacterium]